MTTQEKRNLHVIRCLLSALRLGDLPSGHAYLAVMSIVDEQVYQAMINSLCTAGLIKDNFFLLSLTPAGRELADALEQQEAAR
jgi:hypothetical protein